MFQVGKIFFQVPCGDVPDFWPPMFLSVVSEKSNGQFEIVEIALGISIGSI